jgi:hypothetical protein
LSSDYINDLLARDYPDNSHIGELRCSYSEKGEVIINNSLDLYVDLLKIEIGVLAANNQLYFGNNSTISLNDDVKCGKYIYGWFPMEMGLTTGSILSQYGFDKNKVERAEICHYTYHGYGRLIESASLSIYFQQEESLKSIIKAKEISGEIGKAELGMVGSEYIPKELSIYDPNAITANSRILIPQLDMRGLQLKIKPDYNGQVVVIPMRSEGYFEEKGLDINLLINYRQLESRVWNLEPAVSTGLITSGATGSYGLHYYISLDSNLTPNFDPKVFLEQLAFNENGIVYTTDGHFTEKLVRDAVFATIGVLADYNPMELVNILARNGYNTWLKQNLKVGYPLISWQIAELEYPIIWPVWSNNCAEVVNRCLSYELYYNKEALDNFLYGANVIAEEDIDLKIDGNFITGYLAKISSKKG